MRIPHSPAPAARPAMESASRSCLRRASSELTGGERTDNWRGIERIKSVELGNPDAETPKARTGTERAWVDGCGCDEVLFSRKELEVPRAPDYFVTWKEAHVTLGRQRRTLSCKRTCQHSSFLTGGEATSLKDLSHSIHRSSDQFSLTVCSSTRDRPNLGKRTSNFHMACAERLNDALDH